jgi:hypothetical protein
MAGWRHDADFLAEYDRNRPLSANNSLVLSKIRNVLARANSQIGQLSDESEAASGQSPKLRSTSGRASMMAGASVGGSPGKRHVGQNRRRADFWNYGLSSQSPCRPGRA